MSGRAPTAVGRPRAPRATPPSPPPASDPPAELRVPCPPALADELRVLLTEEARARAILEQTLRAAILALGLDPRRTVFDTAAFTFVERPPAPPG